MDQYRRMRIQLSQSQVIVSPLNESINTDLQKISNLFANSSPFATQYLPQVQDIIDHFDINYTHQELLTITNAFSSDTENFSQLNLDRVIDILIKSFKNLFISTFFSCQLIKILSQSGGLQACLSNQGARLNSHLCQCTFQGQNLQKSPHFYLIWGIRYANQTDLIGLKMLILQLQDDNNSQLASETIIEIIHSNCHLVNDFLQQIAFNYKNFDPILYVIQNLSHLEQISGFFIRLLPDLLQFILTLDQQSYFLDVLRNCIVNLSCEDYLTLSDQLHKILPYQFADDEENLQKIQLIHEDFGINLL